MLACLLACPLSFLAICEASAMSYRAVSAACRYDVSFARHLGGSIASKSASNLRPDSEQEGVFTSELETHAIGLMSDQSRASFVTTVP